MDNIQVSDIQNYFEYIIKKHETVADNSPIKIYVNKTNRQDYIQNKDRVLPLKQLNNLEAIKIRIKGTCASFKNF